MINKKINLSEFNQTLKILPINLQDSIIFGNLDFNYGEEIQDCIIGYINNHKQTILITNPLKEGKNSPYIEGESKKEIFNELKHTYPEYKIKHIPFNESGSLSFWDNNESNYVSFSNWIENNTK